MWELGCGAIMMAQIPMCFDDMLFALKKSCLQTILRSPQHLNTLDLQSKITSITGEPKDVDEIEEAEKSGGD